MLGSIGYSTRRLGDVDKGIGYYHQALAIDPGYTKVREYLGEAYLQKGDVEGRKSSSRRSPTAAEALATTMSFWSRRSPRTSPASRPSTGRANMNAARGSTALFAALAVLVGLVLAVPRAHAVEEMRQFNKDDTKTGRTKACPKGSATARESATASRRVVEPGKSGAAVSMLASTATPLH